MIYIIIRVYFVDTCDIPQEWSAWYIWNSILNIRYTEICFWSWGLFDKYSHYLYILLLWITIVSYMRKKYLFSNNKLFIAWIVIWMGVTWIVIWMLVALYSL